MRKVTVYILGVLCAKWMSRRSTRWYKHFFFLWCSSVRRKNLLLMFMSATTVLTHTQTHANTHRHRQSIQCNSVFRSIMTMSKASGRSKTLTGRHLNASPCVLQLIYRHRLINELNSSWSTRKKEGMNEYSAVPLMICCEHCLHYSNSLKRIPGMVCPVSMCGK